MADTQHTGSSFVVYLATDPAIASFSARWDVDPENVAARAAVERWREASRELDVRASGGEDVTEERKALGPCPLLPELPPDMNYVLTRDLRDVRLVEGATPTRFHVRRLTMSEAIEVRRLPAGIDQAMAAFARGLMSVDGLPEGYSSRSWKRPDDASGKPKPIPAGTIEQLFDLHTVEEIGGVVVHRSFFSRTPSARLLPLPDTSHIAVQASLLLRAGQIRASSPSAASSAPPKATTAATQSSSPRSDAPTPATAPEGTPTTDGPQDGQASAST